MKRIGMIGLILCLSLGLQAQTRMHADVFAASFGLKGTGHTQVAASSLIDQPTSPAPHMQSTIAASGSGTITAGVVVQEELVAGRKAPVWDKIRQKLQPKRTLASGSASGGGNK